MTGGRIKRIQNHIGNENFLLTYGDGVSNIDIKKLVDFHDAHQKICTVSTVQPSGKFGALDMAPNNQVLSFLEKPKGDGSWINGGFFVCTPEIFKYLENDETIFEKEPMESLAHLGQMMAFKHEGFWRPMDTLKDKKDLNDLWNINSAPWKVW
jgi:glucose-1-phosphate cytidylyltransferase